MVRGRHDEADHEQGNNVEEGDAPQHLLRGKRDALERVGCLGGSKTSQLSATESERSRDEHATEALKAIAECTLWCMPVLAANIATVIGRNAAAIDDDGEDDEACTGDDLDDGEDEFNFSIATNAEDLDDDERNEEDGNPYPLVDVASACPVLESDTGGGDFERQNRKPLNRVIPASCKAPGATDETEIVGEESAAHGIPVHNC